jgi:hypothetical protein
MLASRRYCFRNNSGSLAKLTASRRASSPRNCHVQPSKIIEGVGLPLMMKAAIVLGLLIVLAAALAAGRYSLTQQGNMAFEVDRYTGAVWFCTPEGCSRVREQPSSH